MIIFVTNLSLFLSVSFIFMGISELKFQETSLNREPTGSLFAENLHFISTYI